MRFPQKPQGSSPMFHFMQEVWEMLWGRGRWISTPPGTDSFGLQLNETSRGRYWRVSGSAGVVAAPGTSAIMLLNFKAVFGDYTVCTDASGKIIPVAKPQELRNSISKRTIYGNQFNYSYPHNPAGGGPSGDQYAYVMRQTSYTLNGSNVMVKQLLVPPYLTKPNIMIGGVAAATIVPAMMVSGGTGLTLDPLDNITPAGTAITYIEVSHRAWAKSADQTI